jgi:hypothetical protein
MNIRDPASLPLTGTDHLNLVIDFYQMYWFIAM